jgi:aspartyl protease
VRSVLLALAASVSAAQGRPVLEARSPVLDVQDGTHLFERLWTADPTVGLDTYRARRGGPRTITFRSDLGELALEVEPGKEYDFTVRLASGEECPTRVSTLRQPYRRVTPAAPGLPDVIPFRIEDGWMHVTASVNGSPPLDLMFDTGADNLVLHMSALTKGCELRIDGSMLNAGMGGTAKRPTSSTNRLELAGLVLEPELVLYVEKGPCDGILGYVAFEDKVLEIDPDARVLRLHDAVPPEAAGLSRVPMRHDGTILALETGFDTGRARGTDWFLLDTGSAATLHIAQGFAAEHALLDTLHVIGKSESRGVGPEVLRNEIVRLPRLSLGGLALADVPAHVEVPGQASGVSSGNLLGMEVLERFHLFLDLEGMQAWVAPAASFAAPFEVRGAGPSVRILLLGASVLVLVGLAGARWLRVRRSRAPGNGPGPAAATSRRSRSRPPGR